MLNVADLLTDLVRIDSVNPHLAQNGGGERRIAAYIAKYLEGFGIVHEMQPVLKDRPNILAWVAGRDSTARVAFIAHLDTVPAVDWRRDAFGAEREGNRMYGRGTCDTKGSLAAMLHALVAIRNDRPRATIFVVGSVDEEYRKAGARTLAQSGIGFEAAVVGEPTELELVVAHKGSVRWSVETIGRAAHSSQPELGINAITGMARVITAIEEMSAVLKERKHPLVGAPALTMSLIQGGTDLCTVPSRCEISIDRRLVPGESPSAAVEEVEAVFMDLRQRYQGLQVRSILPAVEDPPVDGAADSPIARVASEACAIIAGTGTLRGAPYGTDASQLVGTGAKCVVLGPGCVQQAHTNEEFIALDQLDQAAEIYRRIMLAY